FSSILLPSTPTPATSTLSLHDALPILFSPAHPLTDEEAADQWSLVAHQGGQRIAHRLVYYMGERERLTERWHGAFRDWPGPLHLDRKSTRLNSSHQIISYAVFCLKKKK